MNDLLAVVAALSLLLCLSMPTLVESERLAKRSLCNDSLLNIARANILYAGDAGFYAPASPGGRLRWHGALPKDLSMKADFSQSPLSPYFKKGERMEACPFFKDISRISPPAFEKGGMGYGYNENIGSLRAVSAGFDMWSPECRAKGVAPSAVATPSATAMFTETATKTDPLGTLDISGRLAEMAFCNSFDTLNRGKPCWSTPNPTVHFRHHGKAAAAWADGHISEEAMTFSKGKWASSNLGFFGSRGRSLFDPRATPEGAGAR